MNRRLKVLISAYACEPDKGSEPEVGWQWALQMARFHDVTVLTRANNRLNIEKKLAELQGRQPLPEFVYHEESRFLQQFKQHLSSLKLYYILWQRSARELVARLHHERKFDLLHHVTFAGFRYPTAIWGHGIPCIWGPIGGIESVPMRLLPWGHPQSLFAELKRNAHNLLQATPLQELPKRAQASTIILACTPEMQAAFQHQGFQPILMPTIGLHCQLLPPVARVAAAGPLRLLFVGNLITLKGVDLALRALQASGTNATLTLIGKGNYEVQARNLTRKLGLEKQVTFVGQLPRAEVLRRYAEFDAFLFPSLHDTGGYAVIEAMVNELPVICLACAGPAVAVRAGCGVTVPLHTKAQVCADLATAIKNYDADRSLMRTQGRAARLAILEHYDWDKKGVLMNEVYQQATTSYPEKKPGPYTGISPLTHMIYRLVSFKGLATMVLILLLIGAVGFMSLHHLKNTASQIAANTLPRLTLASQASAYLADSSRTVTFIFSDKPEERTKIQLEIEELSDRTTGYLDKYAESLDTPSDRQLYKLLREDRRHYIQLRSHVLALAAAGQREQAMKEYTEMLLPAHNQVKSTADRLFESDIQHGANRSQEIMAACTFTQITVVLIGIAVFVLGFFFGLFR